jgi:hypothetical protein
LIALDTNILVYAHRAESAWRYEAKLLLTRLCENRAPWALPWPCVHEFLGVVTSARVFKPPTPLDLACAQVEAWINAPSVSLLCEADRHWASLKTLVSAGHVTGPVVHDARIAAICIDHGVSELLSADRDYSRFPALRVRNPLIPAIG